MSRASWQVAAYVLNLSLLASHQVDAAYWREWDVFGVPGGIDLFVAFNVLAVGVLALGLVHVGRGSPGARRFSWLCGGVGGITVVLHAVFLVVDPLAFREPRSIGLLVAIALVSAVQLVLARR